jgi:antirestriction protein ArdC
LFVNPAGEIFLSSYGQTYFSGIFLLFYFFKKVINKCKGEIVMKQSIYEAVTNELIAKLEKGVKPWKCPWERTMLGLPNNLQTGNTYRGVNVLLLWLTSIEKGFASDSWLTFRQASKLGYKIKKGEHGTKCIYFKISEKKIEDEDSDKKRVIKYPMPMTFVVFNLNQIEGMETAKQPILENPIEKAEQVIQASGAVIEIGYNKAYFNLSTDKIHMPSPHTFQTNGNYYATLLHELTHWTGNENRLNRFKLRAKHTESNYAFEELVAEIGSAFLCAELGVVGEFQHASYIDWWLKLLRSDKRLIFKAAKLAQESFDYLTLQTNAGLQKAINA